MHGNSKLIAYVCCSELTYTAGDGSRKNRAQVGWRAVEDWRGGKLSPS